MGEYIYAKPKKPVELEDMKRYLLAVKEPWLAGLLVFLWIFGVRINEAMKLRVESFNFHDPNFVFVDCPPSKNKRNPGRVFPVKRDTPLLPVLMGYVKDCEEGALWEVNVSTFWRRLKEIDPTLCSHRFRHNRATKIALTRAHPYELQSWLGHTDIRMASTYIHDSGVFTDDLGKRLNIR